MMMDNVVIVIHHLHPSSHHHHHHRWCVIVHVMSMLCLYCAGYDELRERIDEGGFMGVKAFFWAELNIQANDGCFKVFHGRCAPYQTW